MTRYLFSYFTSQDEHDGEQVRFARSIDDDPLHWEELHDGRPALVWTEGRGGVRDPFLLRAAGLPGETARFYLLATDLRVHGLDDPAFWAAEQRYGSRGIVIWESSDLVEWTEPRLETVAPEDAGNAWAPEAVFDAERGEYFVFWASTLQPGEAGRSYNRMLAATTTDFRTFSDPFVWSDPGHSVIDATLVSEGRQWYRFVKDERSPESDTPAAAFLTVERSPDLHATVWEHVHDRIGATTPGHPGVLHGEGPIVIPGEPGLPCLLLIDEFGLRRYLPFRGDSLDTDAWTLVEDHTLPPGASHGSVLALTDEEWDRLGR